MDPKKFNFLWVTEFPMFDYDEKEGRYVAQHHPFCMPNEEDLPYLESDPGRVRALSLIHIYQCPGCGPGGHP